MKTHTLISDIDKIQNVIITMNLKIEKVFKFKTAT